MFTIRHIIRVLGFLSLPVLLAACWGEPTYPSQLVEANSLLMRSEYERADSLLQTYAPQSESYPVLMYHRLLNAGVQYKLDRLTTDFATLDSLSRFFNGYGTPDKHVKALLYLGYFYYKNNDYPAALNSYLQALIEAKKLEDTRLIAWSYNQIGKVYDQQGMYEECIEPYRLYYQHACLTGDDRQIAQASAQMGTVYTYNSNVDSAIFCYMHAIELVNKKPYTSDVVSNSRERLADIYIQIEEFDSAAMFMFRDSANSVNWAYWLQDNTI